MTLKHWMTQFKRPGAEYRGAPFWAWNAKLDKKELVRQVGALQRGGFGGFFMHVRSGLATEYLSDEFMDCVKAVVAEAKKRKMQAWLYDEDRWSSGFGGGRVTRNPDYRVRALVWERIAGADFAGCPDEALACFSARIEGVSAFEVRRLGKGDCPPAGHDVLVFRVMTRTGDSWYNYTSYVDTMNPEAIRAFIESTHEVYKRAIGEEFGRTVPGIFTDEPNYGGFSLPPDLHARAYPWTDRFPAEFLRQKGYDLLDHLVALSHRVNGEPFSPARHDYREVATVLYTGAYSQQIGDWCAANGLEFTGHQLGEVDLEGQTDRVGACMRHYEWFQRPGIDVLGDELPEVLTAKQAVSVASQLGRNRVLSEIFGCTGWDATFELYKRIGDWHQVLGVNQFCPHLSWYSMEGEGKRDYPASIFEQSPWWGQHAWLQDYFARISLALSQGTAVREVCVIHPVESAWGLHLKKQNWIVAGLTEALDRLCGHLLDNQYDFDFADEHLLQKYGSVDGRGPAARLRIGQMSYKAVVVPDCLTLSRATLETLTAFAAAGGRLVFLGHPPERVEGAPSPEWAALAGRSLQAPVSSKSVVALLGDDCRAVRVIDTCGSCRVGEPGVWTHVRRTAEGDVLFVVNRDPVHERRLRFAWTGTGRLVELDLMTGSSAEVAGVVGQGDAQGFTVELPPAGSRLYRRIPGASGARPLPLPRVESRRILLPAEWRYTLNEPNACVLDRARMRVGAPDQDGFGPWRPRALLWVHEGALRKEFSLKHDYAQPYVHEGHWSPTAIPVELEFELNVETVPRAPLSLALEHPERFEISLNGKTIRTRSAGWFIDRSLRTVTLAGARLRKGLNRLGVTTVFRQNHHLEDLFLLGPLGVTNTASGPVLTALPRRLVSGDWGSQGLAMYSGAVTYSQTVRVPVLRPGERALLGLEQVKASVVTVAVNGGKPVTVGWDPWQVDVTRGLRPGSNRIDITVVSSRRNALGPFHCASLRPAWTATAELHPPEANRVEHYKLVPYGLMGPVYVSIRRE